MKTQQKDAGEGWPAETPVNTRQVEQHQRVTHYKYNGKICQNSNKNQQVFTRDEKEM